MSARHDTGGGATIWARNGDLLVFAVNGMATASWTSRIPDIKQHLGFSPGQLSILLLGVSFGSLCGLPIAGRIARAIGTRNTVRLGLFLMLPGLLMAAVAITVRAPLPVMILTMFLTGLGIGIWDVAQNLEGTFIEVETGHAIMPWFHAAFSGGTVVAALVSAGLIWLHVPLLAHIAGMVVVVGIAAWWGSGRYLPDGMVTRAETTAGDQVAVVAPAARSAWTEPRTLLIGVMVLAAAFTEGAANDWMAVAFVEGHHLPTALGVVALSVFLVFMTCGRILGTAMLDRYGRVAVLRVLFSAAVVGCLLVVLGPPWLAFVGAAIWGVGASLGFPVGMSAAGDDPLRTSYRISVVSTIGYGAFLGGPSLLGFLGDHFGVLHALLAVGIMAIFALIVVPAARPLTTASGESAVSSG
ncbi:MFS transporter [Propionibacterium sp.]|uniref:MFS transporter n=1 Tax=Propionibacterium sp. TaxID=1977903 RepID=UPI0039ED11E1